MAVYAPHTLEKRQPAPRQAAPAAQALRHAMQGAELVAVRIAQIGEIELAHPTLAHARRVFDRGAAIGDAGVVPGFRLVARGGCEADGGAVCARRALAVD